MHAIVAIKELLPDTISWPQPRSARPRVDQHSAGPISTNLAVPLPCFGPPSTGEALQTSVTPKTGATHDLSLSFLAL